MGSTEPCLLKPSGGSHRSGIGFAEGGKGTPYETRLRGGKGAMDANAQLINSSCFDHLDIT